MADFMSLKSARNRAGEIVYHSLNALLPFVLLLLVWAFDPPYVAYALVLLSKWRIFALRPRFWWVNIKTNLVDVSVGISVVGLMFVASSMPVMQIMLAIAYAAWLLFLKPRSGAHSILLQAGIAQFLSLTALFNFSLVVPEIVVILLCWVIGYMVARHVMSNYEESNLELLSMLWALIIAELGWLAYRWSTVYDLGLPIKIPQIALLVFVFSYATAQLYHHYKRGLLTKGMIRSMVLFSVAVIAMLLVFSPWDATI